MKEVFMKSEKDWLGNSSFFIQNHRKKDSEVSEADFYATHPNSVRTFLDFYNPGKNDLIWECACGTGNISKVLIEKGYKVYSTDLVDRGYGDGQFNFLQAMTLPKPLNIILTNPPYKYAEDFLEQAMRLLPQNGYYIAFLPLTFLEGKNRYQLFQTYTPDSVYIHSSRQGCDSKGRFDFTNGGARCYCWIVWRKQKTEINNGTTIYWLPPN
jgi:tRNA/tmRNA/rRNA uracil-C5-methylase (TrmA/RlmC/RlmD family)